MKKQSMYRSDKISMVITNLVRLTLIILFIRGIIVRDHSQDFIIILTFFLTYYPSVLEKRFGVYLPSRMQIIITLFIFAAQVLGEMERIL